MSQCPASSRYYRTLSKSKEDRKCIQNRTMMKRLDLNLLPFSSILSKAASALLVLTFPNISFILVVVLQEHRSAQQSKHQKGNTLKETMLLWEGNWGWRQLCRLSTCFQSIFLWFCLLHFALQKLHRKLTTRSLVYHSSYQKDENQKVEWKQHEIWPSRFEKFYQKNFLKKC
jgi:hypothetical protein